MSALCARFVAIAGLTGAVLLGTSVARAAPKDTDAEELIKKAIYTDYLGTKFADAEKKLKQALSLCKPSAACSPQVRAKIYCDLGIVYIGGMNRADDGKAQFVEALKQDASVTPDSDLVSPEIEAAFGEAKAGGKGAPSDSKSTQPAPTQSPSQPAASGSGDLVHTPPPEQATLTPLPLYAELPSGVNAAKVQLSYKPFGASEWKSLGMKATGKGFGAEIACAEVGSAQGEFSYYIQAFDSSQNLVSWSGSRSAPNKVAIKTSIQGEAPHLPGEPPPAKCPDTGDCPPEFPGCKGNKPPSCDPADPNCVPEGPAPETSTAKKNWLSLAIQQDFLVLSGSGSTCAGTATKTSGQVTGYDCFTTGNPPTYYTATPYAGSGDQVRGGLGVATTRILLGYDRVVWNLTFGARVGFAFRGGPTAPGGNAFFPVHGEARVAYWFGSDPFGRVGPRPYVLVDGGVAEVDSSLGVTLYNNQQDYNSNTQTHLTAWRKTGTAFVGGGVGMLFGITPRMGPFVEAKLMQLIGASATGFNLAVGYAFGL